MKNVEFSFVRGEKNNEIVLFINARHDWFEKDIEIGLTSENELVVKFPNELDIKSSVLQPLLLEQVSLRNTKTVFVDENMDFMAEMILEPMNLNYGKESVRKFKP